MRQEMPLAVVPWGRGGYDLRVTDPRATVDDYLSALNNFIENASSLRRQRVMASSCEACDGCCHERIPLTSIDVLRLGDPGAGWNLQQVLAIKCRVQVDGEAVDISLGVDAAGQCLCFDPSARLCRIYDRRPLVCQTFICCPASPRALALREVIVNKGEDQLVRRWWQEARALGRPPVMHQAWNAGVRLENFPASAFEGAGDYREVRLQDLCPPRLWQQLGR